MRYTRDELQHLLAARAGQMETRGANAFIELRIKVTPELLEGMLGGQWIAADGTKARFDGVDIRDGYAEPILVREVPA